MQEMFTVQAAASITASANGAAVIPTFVNNSGFNALTSLHNAVGVYLLDLDTPLAAADAVVIPQVRGAAADQSILGVVHTSDIRKTVTVGVAGAASDAVSFDIVVFRRPSA